MATAVRGCVFCSIIHGQRDKHLKSSDNAVVIQDRSPHAPHHYLILSKLHINQASDLTVVDLPLGELFLKTFEDMLHSVLSTTNTVYLLEAIIDGFHYFFSVKEMDHLGRDYLRETLKEKGEADTVEGLLRMGFHWSIFVTVRHLHMHLLYPTREMNFIYRSIIFRSGRFFRTTKNIIDNLEKKKSADGRIDRKKEVKSTPAVTGQNDLPDTT